MYILYVYTMRQMRNIVVVLADHLSMETWMADPAECAAFLSSLWGQIENSANLEPAHPGDRICGTPSQLFLNETLERSQL